MNETTGDVMGVEVDNEMTEHDTEYEVIVRQIEISTTRHWGNILWSSLMVGAVMVEYILNENKYFVLFLCTSDKIYI